MDTLFSEKPPWKCVEWMRSLAWDSASILFAPWIHKHNETAHTMKESIGSLDKAHRWELAKKMVNPYELVYTHGDERLPTSLSLAQPLSRSYFKMIEMLDVLDFFKRIGTSKIRTAHVAEGPGGFIQAILGAAENKQKTITNTYAMTLRPNTSHVPGWKKAVTFLFKHRQVKVLYGEDGTGDIYSRTNQDMFVSTCGPASTHIFTADGGFDFSVDYAQQEQKVYHLLLCSVTIGFQVLRKQGTFVIKLFDCESPNTQFLVAFMARHFEEWTLYKPAMTRPCNSERYFLGRGFRGLSETALDLLYTLQAKSAEGLFPMSQEGLLTHLENDFIQRHLEKTVNLQIKSIELAIQLSENPRTWFQSWYKDCLDKSYLWCETFRIVANPKAEHLRQFQARFAEV